MWVYDDGVIKGFVQVSSKEIKKLFVEPALQGNAIGSNLLNFAIEEFDAYFCGHLKRMSEQSSFISDMAFVRHQKRNLKKIPLNILFAWNGIF